MPNVTIYALQDPATAKFLYVGQTNNPAKRMSEHRTHGRRELQALFEKDPMPIMTILDCVPRESATATESALIQKFLGLGHPLLNRALRQPGETFRERERIKRKIQRWTARLKIMPRLERQALLCAIAETAKSGEGVL